MDSVGPVLVMSSERSGSNLLRTLLSNHPALSAPVAPQLLTTFHPARRLYEPLEDEANAVALVRDMIEVANHAQFDWRLEADAGELVRGRPPRDLYDAVDLVYRADMERAGARRYVSKENRLFDHAGALLERDPGTRVVWLHRDVRDYVASWLGVPLLNHTPHESACTWRDEQRACRAVEEVAGDRLRRVGYEELIADPAGTLTAVLRFLDLDVDPACFEVRGEKNAGMAWSAFWTNLSKPVMADNARKYRTAYDRRTLRMVETVARDEMALLGLEPETAQDWRPGPFFGMRERRLARREDRRLRQEHADTVGVIRDRRRLVDELLDRRRVRDEVHA